MSQPPVFISCVSPEFRQTRNRVALRLIRALAVEIHEDWIEAHRYLNMEILREQRKRLQLLEAA